MQLPKNTLGLKCGCSNNTNKTSAIMVSFLNENKSRKIDFTDIQIIRIIDDLFNKQNYSPSTKQISELLVRERIFDQKIPPRTIRYRISKLKERGILQRKIPITHERKLGIGESFFIVDENPENRSKFYKVLDDNLAIDWYIPTYGKYNGYYVHTIYSLDSQNHPHRVFQLLKEKRIIGDYINLDLIDYKVFGWNYKYFDTNGKWTWNWAIWKDHLINELKGGTEKKIQFDIEASRINFDYIDVQILKLLYLDDTLPLKQLGMKLKLSESQVGRRIKIMEKKGIIRGYRTGFYPFATSNPFLVKLISNKNMNQIFYHLSKIPYPLTIAYETPSNFAFAIEIPTEEISDFLEAFYSLKSLVDDYMIQFLPKNPNVNIAEGFNFYENDLDTWNKLNKEYAKSIKILQDM